MAIYDRGIDAGRHYLVLEYVPGGDFHDHVQRNGPLPLSEAIGVIRSVASGLKYAASRGLIHRDIKPSNILRSPRGEAKIIDLGLALQSHLEDERVTREGTTVGTVDYMAPEQARDSRATSILSDMYSLGCTFYYLLSGTPPFPGGDITDKLTRHARSPAPDIRDLRPDIPAGVAAILLRLLAKNPEDRYGNYDDLIAALDAAATTTDDQTPGIPLVPLDAEVDDDWVPPREVSSGGPPPGSLPLHDSDDALIPMASLAELALLTGEPPASPPHAEAGEMAPPLPRGHRSGGPTEPEDVESEVNILRTSSGRSATSWILSSTVIGAAFVILVVGIHQFMGGSRISGIADEDFSDFEDDAISIPNHERTGGPVSGIGTEQGSAGRRKFNQLPGKLGGISLPPPWIEPEDKDSVPGKNREDTFDPPNRRWTIPEWARTTAPEPASNPVVMVRRVPEPSGDLTKPTLHVALDEIRGGIAELADQGPLPIEDVNISGESRLIRARPGYRPILYVERASANSFRHPTSVLSLERKNIAFEGIDLVVNVLDLAARQTAFFACAGTDLTFKDCTITILNPRSSPFTFIRAEPSSVRPSRIRLQRTMVRGSFGPAVEMLCGQCDLVLDRTVILCGTGPVIRITSPDAANEHRICFMESVVAGPGPIIQQAKAENGAKTRPMLFRSYGSVFGRVQVPGVASVIASADAGRGAGQQVDWAGDRNLFAGWRGFFARGSEPTILVDDLAGVRSTWSATERDSLQILQGWPGHTDLATISPKDLDPFLPSDRREILAARARPGPGLFEKAAVGYPTPLRPETIDPAPTVRSPAGGDPGRIKSLLPDAKSGNSATGAPGPRRVPGGLVAVAVAGELAMNLQDIQWGGDLGAFLAARVTSEMKRVRIRVEGSGSHPFTPVQLPPGLDLEIRVEPGSQYRATFMVASASGDRSGLDRAPGWSPESARRHHPSRSRFSCREPDLDGKCPSRPLAMSAHSGSVFDGGERRVDSVSCIVNPAEVERSSPPVVHGTGRSTGMPDIRLGLDRERDGLDLGARPGASLVVELRSRGG